MEYDIRKVTRTLTKNATSPADRGRYDCSKEDMFASTWIETLKCKKNKFCFSTTTPSQQQQQLLQPPPTPQT